MLRMGIVIITCFATIFAVSAAAENSDWMSFTGFNIPSPAEIEVVEQDSNSVVVDVSLNGVYVDERIEGGSVFQFLSLPDADWMRETGKPRLPVVRTLLTIPSDGELYIQIEEEEHVSLSGYRVYPFGKEVVRNSAGGTVYIGEEFALNEDFYSTDAPYPRELTKISFSGYLREQRIAQLQFHPIRYRPASGELICYTFLRVRLNYGGMTRFVPNSLGLLKSVFKNEIPDSYGMVPQAFMTSRTGTVSYPEDLSKSQNADYLIIASDPFYGSSKLKELAQWRAEYNGFDVAIASTSRLYHNFGSGRNLDESIRAFVQHVYNYWKSNNIPDGRIGYILLIGDVESIPIHVSDKKSFNETIVTDNWYVCVSGDDLMPDIMLGRLPAKSMTELNIMVDKIIGYEKEPLYGDWANRALLMSGTVESLYEDMKQARDEYLLPAGYDVNEVSALDGGNVYKVIAEMNKGHLISDYAGHGFVSSWEIFQARDIPKLKNDRMLPAIFSLACSTGQFDDPSQDSLAEAFVKSRNGAIAFFGSSRLAAISEVGFGLSEAVAKSHIYTLGEITMHTKLKLLPNSTNMELYNLIGDPALDLSAPRRTPGMADIVISPVDISFDPEMPRQGDEVAIKVTINNFGADDARNVKLELRDNSSNSALLETNTISRIPSRSKVDFQTLWRVPLGKAQHIIHVEAYPENRALESYKKNNNTEKSLMVSLEADGFPLEAPEKNLSAPVSADIDGDGDMELIIQTVNYSYTNKVYIWHHDGQTAAGWPKTISRTNYNTASQYVNPSAGPAPSIGDLDGDGVPEIVAVSFSDRIYAWRNDGSVMPGWPIRTNGNATSSPALADLDLDGKMEVIIGVDTGQIEIRRHDGSMFPGWSIGVGRRGHIFASIMDIDGDTDLEIIALHSPLPKSYDENDTSSIYAWHHDGTPVSGWPVKMKGANSVLPVLTGDLDGDGTGEVVAVSDNGDLCKIYIWNHNGSLLASWSLPNNDEIRSSIAIGDIDHDGDAEVIAASRDNFVYAWHHNGKLVYGWPAYIDEGYWISAPILGDVDGDDQTDIILASHGSVIYVFKGDGTPLDGWPSYIDERSSVSPTLITDMDGDGKVELVFASFSGNVHMFSLIGNYGSQASIEWNMFLHDQMHTASYDAKAILPLPPQNLTVSDLPDDRGGSVILTWELSPDDSKMTGYIIYRSEKPDGEFTLIGKVANGVSTYIDDTANDGVNYWYIVRTTDSRYLSISSLPVSGYSFNNFAPNIPSSLYVNQSKIDGSLDVWWTMSEETNLAGYRVYFGTSPRTYDRTVDVGKINHYLLTGLVNDTQYYISITAYDSEGNESLHTNEVSAIPRDDDTDPPEFSNFYPAETVEATDFHIKCIISDPSGIYDDDTRSDGQGVYLLWNTNGDLSDDAHPVRMSLSFSGLYVTDSMIPGQPVGTEITYQIYAYDNDSDWGRTNDRSQGMSEKKTIRVVPSPSLAYNYPNPAPSGEFNDRTIFRYHVESDADVRISIYDVAGNLVDRFENSAKGGGYNETQWLISDVASGIYIYVIEIQPYSGSKQVIKKKLAILK